MQGEGPEPVEQVGDGRGQGQELENQVRQTCPVVALILPTRNLGEPQTIDISEN